ncbi:hypothetical_protein [Candidozyma auris]|uniref:hypothetical_protein n=1 Tax=Candidozyma auris TaxID=498019 RepID=UPI000D2EB31F|nr:hypothetical_protein [[Candida] auris]QEO20084.1 hypothetical_protein [[Candida] auris]GBL49942.1 hypothetical protein CAJCM15448_22160 [[Candida] auris]
MASPILISNPPPGFSILAIVRGFQLAILGAYRTLQNPSLLTQRFYRQSLIAIQASIVIQGLIWSPIIFLRVLLKLVAVATKSRGLDHIVHSLKSFQFNVLNISVFLISGSRFFSKQLDDLFLQSLKFIDETHLSKHPQSDRLYHENLVALSTEEKIVDDRPTIQGIKKKWATSQEFSTFMRRHINRTLMSIGVYFLSKVPFFGPVILGLVSYSNLDSKIGTMNAAVIFGVLQLVPKRWAVLFLTTYWGSRSMTHDLLAPYFSRVRFTKSEKDQWIRSREGLLFGFGLCHYLIIRRLPWVGLLLYGFAESSVAYLVTKVSDPPPRQISQLVKWNSSQLVWNREKELDLLSGSFVDKDEGFQPVPGSYIFQH